MHLSHIDALRMLKINFQVDCDDTNVVADETNKFVIDLEKLKTGRLKQLGNRTVCRNNGLFRGN